MPDIVFFGTYDLTKPRQKIIIEAAFQAGFTSEQIHKDIWKLRDKSEHSILLLLFMLFSGAVRSLWLQLRYLLCSKHKYVFIGYPGIVDIFLVWPIARLRGVKIVYDCYLPLYEIFVEERKLIKASGLLSGLIYAIENLICSMADILITDTKAHAEYLSSLYKNSGHKIKVVFVGAEKFFEVSQSPSEIKLNLLFYGQLAPLHGFEYILDAIKILEKEENVFFTVIGESSKQPELKNLTAGNFANVCYKRWVDYENLIDELNQADVCLGIFGKTKKADRVIANKVYQGLSAGNTVITGRTKAIAEIQDQIPPDQLLQVQPGDGQQLAEAIRFLARQKKNKVTLKYPARSFYPYIVEQLKHALS